MSLPAGAIKFGAAVQGVVHQAGAVFAVCRHHRCKACALVMALAPVLAGRIDYQPPLDARRDGLTQRLAMARSSSATWPMRNRSGAKPA